MSKLTRIIRPYQGVLFPVILLAFCAGVFLFGVVPAVKGIFTLREESVTLSGQISTIRQKVTLLEALDESTLLNQLSTLTSAVPTENSPAQVLSTIDAVSVQTGTTIVSVEIGSPGVIATDSAKRQTSEEKQLGTRTAPFIVTLEGTMDQVRAFLSQVAEVRQFLRVSTFTISFNEEGIAKATIGMTGFFTPLPVSIGTEAQELTPLTEDEEAYVGQVARIPIALVSEQPIVAPAPGPFRPDPFSP